MIKEESDGSKYWILNNQLHREDGPAIEYISGDQEWYHHGKIHRIGGPAILYANGYQAWWITNEVFSFSDYCNEVIRMGYMTEEEVSKMILKYS